MRVRAWLAAVAIFAVTVAASSGFSVAQTGGAFKVVGVPIDQTAESAAAARTLALAAGQQEAYRRLVRRLALLGDIGTAPAASPALLREIVSGIAVESEKTSSVRYLASLTVDFDPAAVRKRFLAAGLRWAETQSKPLVVLPVFRTQGTVQLWDRTNIWHQTWRDAPESDGLIRLIVPPGETSDLAAISPSQALSGDEARISVIAEQYGAGGALLLAATLSSEPGTGHVLAVSINRFSSAGSHRASTRSFAANPDTTVSELMTLAVNQVRRDIEEEWKFDNLLRFGEQQELVAVAPLSGLRALIRIKRLLQSVAEIRSFELISVTREEARFRLRYLGDPAQLEFALAQKDLALTQGAVDWQLALKGPG